MKILVLGLVIGIIAAKFIPATDYKPVPAEPLL
jgi:hypothetical protein